MKSRTKGASSGARSTLLILEPPKDDNRTTTIITLSRPRGVSPHLVVVELQRGQVGRRRFRLAARLVPQFLGRGCNLKRESNTKTRQYGVSLKRTNKKTKGTEINPRKKDSFINGPISGSESRGGRRGYERTYSG